MKFLITGASRGLGLGLVQLILQDTTTTHEVIAAARNPSSAQDLQALKETQGGHKLIIATLDVESQESISKFVQEHKDDLRGLNVLVNNAGVGTTDNSLNTTAETLIKTFNTNLVAPAVLTSQLYNERLFASQQENSESSTSPSSVIHISSAMGSLALVKEENPMSALRAAAYRISKAALNMLSRVQALDLVGVSVVAVHPGWVQTDMGWSTAKGFTDTPPPLTVIQSVTGILNNVIKRAKEHHAKFVDFEGKEFPW